MATYKLLEKELGACLLTRADDWRAGGLTPARMQTTTCVRYNGGAGLTAHRTQALLRAGEQRFRVRKMTLVAMLAPALAIFYFLDLGPQALCTIVGYAYPAVASMRAIESSSKADDTMWLTYWTMFASMRILESFLFEWLVATFPFYWAFKLGFLVWMQSPQTKGAIFMYSHMLSPFLKTHAVVPMKD